MSRRQQHLLRKEIVLMAKRCERLATDALREENAGRTGAAKAHRMVAHHFSSVAFSAAAWLAELRASR